MYNSSELSNGFSCFPKDLGALTGKISYYTPPKGLPFNVSSLVIFHSFTKIHTPEKVKPPTECNVIPIGSVFKVVQQGRILRNWYNFLSIHRSLNKIISPYIIIKRLELASCTGAMLGTFLQDVDLILRTFLGMFYPHFIDEETESQRSVQHCSHAERR